MFVRLSVQAETQPLRNLIEYIQEQWIDSIIFPPPPKNWSVFKQPIRTNNDIRDFKIWYGKALVRRQIVKITSGDVMTPVPVQLSRCSLAFYYGKVPGFTYSSLLGYKPVVYFSF